jgi:hypothetical protein
MADETGKAIVICPTCRRPTEHHLGWFRTVGAWDCPFCAAALEIDVDRLATFLASKPPEGAEFVARLSLRQTGGITTRRSR